MKEEQHLHSFYEEFEVFSRRTPTAPFQHQFSLLAPNHELALVMAQENFMRRDKVADIWVVHRQAVHGLDEANRKSLHRLDNKDYRLTKGYGYIHEKWRAKQQNVLDDHEIFSWAEGKKNGEKNSKGS